MSNTTLASPPPYTPAQYAYFARDAQATTFVGAAALALILFDWVLTFPQEFELYWRGRWTYPRVLFFWNRYVPIFVLLVNFISFTTKDISNDLCQGWFIFEGLTGLLSVVVSDLIMILRVYILYRKTKKMLWILSAIFIIETGLSLTLIGIGLVIPSEPVVLPITEDARLRGLVSGCYTSDYPAELAAWFFPPLATATILFAFTLYKTSWTLKLRDRHRQAPLVTLVLDHTIVNYVSIVATLATNAFVWFFARATIASVGISLAVCILSITGSRLLIDLRTSGNNIAVRSGQTDTQTELATFAGSRNSGFWARSGVATRGAGSETVRMGFGEEEEGYGWGGGRSVGTGETSTLKDEEVDGVLGGKKFKDADADGGVDLDQKRREWEEHVRWNQQTYGSTYPPQAPNVAFNPGQGYLNPHVNAYANPNPNAGVHGYNNSLSFTQVTSGGPPGYDYIAPQAQYYDAPQYQYQYHDAVMSGQTGGGMYGHGVNAPVNPGQGQGEREAEYQPVRTRVERGPEYRRMMGYRDESSSENSATSETF